MKNIPIRKIKSSSSEPKLSERFGIRSIREMLAGKDMIQELHRHDFFFILVLKKGSGSHEIDFISYTIGDYSIFFMRPGQVHQLTLKTGSTGYLIEFNADFYYPKDKLSAQLLQKVSNRNLCQLDAEKIKRLFSLLDYILNEYNDKKENYQQVIKANLGIFFIELMRQRQNKEDISNTTHSYQQEQLDKFLELIEKNSSTHKQVSQYAEMLNLSAYQLNAISKTILGKTSSDLINEYIILEAKRYLLATTSQISQIAYHLGYQDISYFIRFFKKHTGYSPEAFRQNFK